MTVSLLDGVFLLFVDGVVVVGLKYDVGIVVDSDTVGPCDGAVLGFLPDGDTFKLADG